MRLSMKDLQSILFSNRENLRYIQERTTGFSRMLHQLKYWQSELKKRDEFQKSCCTFKLHRQEIFNWKYMLSFMKKKIMILKKPGPEGRALSHRGLSPICEIWVCLVGILNFLRLVTIFFLPHCLFLNANVCTCYLMLVPQCILKVYDLFSNFTGT